MTFDWRQVPCSPLNRGKVVAHGETQVLAEALATRWEKDSHFVPYCLFREDKKLDRIPRINKPGLAWVKELCDFYALKFDVQNLPSGAQFSIVFPEVD
jgi:hypothetical protein